MYNHIHWLPAVYYISQITYFLPVIKNTTALFYFFGVNFTPLAYWVISMVYFDIPMSEFLLPSKILVGMQQSEHKPRVRSDISALSCYRIKRGTS